MAKVKKEKTVKSKKAEAKTESKSLSVKMFHNNKKFANVRYTDKNGREKFVDKGATVSLDDIQINDKFQRINKTLDIFAPDMVEAFKKKGGHLTFSPSYGGTFTFSKAGFRQSLGVEGFGFVVLSHWSPFFSAKEVKEELEKKVPGKWRLEEQKSYTHIRTGEETLKALREIILTKLQ